MQAPLVQPSLDPHSPQRKQRGLVQCGSGSGTLQCTSTGDVEYEPLQLSPVSSSFSCCDPSGNAKRQVFSRAEVVGATLEQGSVVRIWLCRPSGAKPSASTANVVDPGQQRVSWRLHKSDRFTFADAAEAQQFVRQTQAAVSWWGRKQPPRVVAIVNPVSGRGKAHATFSQTVLPLLADAAGMSVEVHTSTHRGHPTAIVAGLNMEQVDLVLYVGGDGTVFEGMQGLFGRPDWATAALVPFATVPSGSGNGLAASVGIFDAVSAAYSVCKAAIHPIDVASVLQPPNSRWYLMLSLTYGMIANLDIGTEHLRWMGEPRFTLGGVSEILSGRSYPVRVAVWPEEEPVPASSACSPSLPATHAAGSPTLLGIPVLDPPAVAAPPGRPQPDNARAQHDERIELLVDTGPSSSSFPAAPHSPTRRATGGSAGSASHAAAAAERPPQASISATSGTGAPAHPGARVIGAPAAGEPQTGASKPGGSAPCLLQQAMLAGPPLPILSQLGQSLPGRVPTQAGQLPPGWQVLPDQVGLEAKYFMVHNTQWVALSSRLNPQGQLADGLWDLITVSGLTGWAGTAAGVEMLLKSETGDHVFLDYVRSQRVRALMLEPLAGATTWTVLDGESVPNRPLFLEVHPRAARVLTAPGWRDLPSRPHPRS